MTRTNAYGKPVAEGQPLYAGTFPGALSFQRAHKTLSKTSLLVDATNIEDAELTQPTR